MNTCATNHDALSAFLDGELDAAGRDRLEQHLAACAACREWIARCREAERLLAAPAPAPQILHDLEGRVARALALDENGRRSRPAAPQRRSLLRFATAALVLIAVSLAMLASSDEAGAGRAAEPIAALSMLAEQAAHDQAVLEKTLEWELRALRLEVACLDLGAAESDPISARIDELLARVGRADAKNRR